MPAGPRFMDRAVGWLGQLPDWRSPAGMAISPLESKRV